MQFDVYVVRETEKAFFLVKAEESDQKEIVPLSMAKKKGTVEMNESSTKEIHTKQGIKRGIAAIATIDDDYAAKVRWA